MKLRQNSCLIRLASLLASVNLTTTHLCTNKDKYKQGKMLKFWVMIKALLKQQNGIDFASPRQTVEKWCEIESQALMDKKIESGTTHDKNDFWEKIEEFFEHVLKVKSERKDKKKTTEEKLDKARAVARVQDKFIAEIDDDDNKYDSAQLSALHYKKRRKTENFQLDVATVVVQGIKESMATLETSLKETMMGTDTNKDNSRVMQLEKDNKVLQEDNKVLKYRRCRVRCNNCSMLQLSKKPVLLMYDITQNQYPYHLAPSLHYQYPFQFDQQCHCQPQCHLSQDTNIPLD